MIIFSALETGMEEDVLYIQGAVESDIWKEIRKAGESPDV